MKLITERLIMDEITMHYLQQVHELHSLPETDRYNTLGIPTSLSQTEELLKSWISLVNTSPKNKFVFVLLHKDTGAFTGLFGINMGKPNYRNAEIWYKLLPAYWNKGYATECTGEILRLCFNELGLHRVEAGCAVDNLASVKVLEKSGFIKEGRTRKLLPIRGEWVDNYFYAILEEDFK
ncbi:MAG: GNAT family protein [Bacteroidota bacterium]